MAMDYVIMGGAVAAGAVSWRALVRRLERENGADWGPRWLNRLDGFNRLFCRHFHGLRFEPLALPLSGPAIVVSNHLSGLDPLVMSAAASRPLRFMIAAEEYDRWWLRWFFHAIGCIPVERTGRPQRALAIARQALEAGEVIALFPHGRIVRDGDRPPPLKRGVLHLAETTGAPIVPMRLEGVRAQGWTVPAVVVPSRVRITSFPPVQYEGRDGDALLTALGALLTGQGSPANG